MHSGSSSRTSECMLYARWHRYKAVGRRGRRRGWWKRCLISEAKPGLEDLLHEPPFALKVLRDIIVIGRQDLFDGYVDSKVAP